MSERYSSKKQEALFQPLRIQVVATPPGRQHWNRTYYDVWIRNVADLEEAPVVWCEVSRFRLERFVWAGWSDELPEGVLYQSTVRKWQEHDTETVHRKDIIWASEPRAMSKKDAIEIAKREAVRRGLPFDLQRDFVVRAEIVKGPRQPCVSCGEKADYRSHNPYLCHTCKLYVSTGRKVRADETRVDVGFSYFLPPEEFLDYNSPLKRHGSAIYQALGRVFHVELSKTQERDVEELAFFVRSPRDGTSRRRPVFPAKISLEQAEAAQELVDYIWQVAEQAFNKGKREGESTLLNLAGGTMAMVEMPSGEAEDGE